GTQRVEEVRSTSPGMSLQKEYLGASLTRQNRYSSLSQQNQPHTPAIVRSIRFVRSCPPRASQAEQVPLKGHQRILWYVETIVSSASQSPVCHSVRSGHPQVVHGPAPSNRLGTTRPAPPSSLPAPPCRAAEKSTASIGSNQDHW